MSKTTGASVAYVVPKTVWDRTMQALNVQNQKKTGDDQSGGGVAGIGRDGRVQSEELLKSMATNLSLTQTPKLEFVKHADLMMKKVMADPHLLADDKVRFLRTYAQVYQGHRQSAR